MKIGADTGVCTEIGDIGLKAAILEAGAVAVTCPRCVSGAPTNRRRSSNLDWSLSELRWILQPRFSPSVGAAAAAVLLQPNVTRAKRGALERGLMERYSEACWWGGDFFSL